MKYQIVKFTLNVDDSRLTFIKVYDEEYESRSDAEIALSYMIDNKCDEEGEFDGRIPLWEITNLPSKLKDPTIEDKCYWYTSSYICEGAMNFVKEYSSNHNIPIESI